MIEIIPDALSLLVLLWGFSKLYLVEYGGHGTLGSADFASKVLLFLLCLEYLEGDVLSLLGLFTRFVIKF